MDKELIKQRLAENARKQLEIYGQIKRYKAENGAEFFKPYWYQQKLIDAMWGGKKTLLLQAANQAGKTLTGSCLIDSFFNGVQAWDKRASVFGGKPTKGRIVCTDWENHAKEVMVPKLRSVIKAGTYETTKNNMGVEAFWKNTKNGSQFNILTQTQDTMAHESDTIDWVWFDEPPPKDKYTANVRGLVSSYGICLMTMTSLKEAWILDDLVMGEDPIVQRDFFGVTGVNIKENRSLTAESIERFTAACPEDEREARINGGWLQLTGLVLKKFRRDVHVRPAFKVPVDWPVVAFIDPHPNTPYAIGFYAVTPYGRKYVIDEFWGNVNGAGEAADEIIRRKRLNGWNLDTVYIDPYAKGDVRENASDELDDTFHKIEKRLNAYDIVLYTAQRSEKAKIIGVDNLSGWLMGANLEPSLFFFDTCRRHIYEIQRWKYDEEGKPKKCVSGDTLIDTPNGQHRIKDLVGKELLVYSYSTSDKMFKVNKAYHIRKTAERQEIWKLTMDRCCLFATPDHLVLLRNGMWKMLKDLKPYESLMPLYRVVMCDGYTVINPDGTSRIRASEHRYIYTLFNGKIPSGYEVHHRDGNYLNHNPDNLEIVSSVEHQTIHIAKGGEKICKECGEKFNAKRTYSKFCRQECSQSFYDKNRGKNNSDKHCRHCLKKLEIGYRQGRKEFCNSTCKGKFYREKRGVLNHKVVSVQFYGYEDVFNMEVENDHNFIANGIVIHNCDDHFMENLYRFSLENIEYTEPGAYNNSKPIPCGVI